LDDGGYPPFPNPRTQCSVYSRVDPVSLMRNWLPRTSADHSASPMSAARGCPAFFWKFAWRSREPAAVAMRKNFLSPARLSCAPANQPRLISRKSKKCSGRLLCPSGCSNALFIARGECLGRSFQGTGWLGGSLVCLPDFTATSYHRQKKVAGIRKEFVSL